MGEAWFYGRKMYHSMLDGSDVELSSDLSEALWEIATGQRSFGPDADPEWTGWLHYQLWRFPELAQDRLISDDYSTCITAFMTRYPAGAAVMTRYPTGILEELDRDLADDVLATLGRVKLIGKYWQSDFNPTKPVFCSDDPSSGALLLMIKYLADEDLPAWWRSVITIDNPVWRINLLIWLAAASPIFLDPTAQPGQFNDYSGASWHTSDVLNGKYAINGHEPIPFLSVQRQQAICELFRETLTMEALLAWVSAFEPLQPLAAPNLYGTVDYLLEAANVCAASYALREVN
jgi:hypothetical protein